MYQPPSASKIYFPLPPSSSRSPTEHGPAQGLSRPRAGEFSAAKIQSVEIDMDMSALRTSLEQPTSPLVGFHACSKDLLQSPHDLLDKASVGHPACPKDLPQSPSKLFDKPFVSPRELKAHYAQQRLAFPAHTDGLAALQTQGLTKTTKAKCVKYPISYRLRSNPEQARKHLPRDPSGPVPVYAGLSSHDTSTPSNDRPGLVYPSIRSPACLEQGKPANQSSLGGSDVGSAQPSIAQREQFVYYNLAKRPNLGHPNGIHPVAAPGVVVSASSSSASSTSCDASMTNLSPKSAATTVDGSVNSSADWAYESLKADPEKKPAEAMPYEESLMLRKGSVLDRPRPLCRGRGASFCTPDIEFDRMVGVNGLKPSKSFDRGRRKWLAPPLPVPNLQALNLDGGTTRLQPCPALALQASWAHPPAPMPSPVTAPRAHSPTHMPPSERQNNAVTDGPQTPPAEADLIIKSRPSILAPLALLEETPLCLELNFDGSKSPLDHVQYRKAIESLLIKMESQGSRDDKSANKGGRSTGKSSEKMQSKIAKLNLKSKALLGARKTQQPQQHLGEHQRSGKNGFLHGLFS